MITPMTIKTVCVAAVIAGTLFFHGSAGFYHGEAL
jgi:hypothetical protein